MHLFYDKLHWYGFLNNPNSNECVSWLLKMNVNSSKKKVPNTLNSKLLPYGNT